MGRSYIFVLIVWFGLTQFANANAQKRILYISSYNSSFPTYFDQMEGLRSVFDTIDVVIDVECLDGKRLDGELAKYLLNFTLEYKFKTGIKYDVILVADDLALNYVLEQKETYFSDVPIVFFGVNDIERAILQDKDPLVTGVIEDVSIKETVELMLRLFSNAKKICVISDATITGKFTLDQFKDITKDSLKVPIQFVLLDEMSYDAFTHQLEQIDSDVPILLLSALKDKENAVKNFKESLRLIKEHVKSPLFHLWYHGIEDGVLGGKVVSQREQAKQASLMAYKILKGTKVDEIKVLRKSPNSYAFNSKQLNHFGIPIKSLPDNSTFFANPDSFFVKYKVEIFIGMFFFIFQFVLIFYLLAAFRNRVIYEKKLKIQMAEYFALNEEYQKTNGEFRKANVDLIEAESKLKIKMSELAESEEKYRFLFNNLSEAFVLFEFVNATPENSADFIIKEMNASFVESHQLNYESVIGERVSDVFPDKIVGWLNDFSDVARLGVNVKMVDYNCDLDKYFEIHAFSPRKMFFAAIFNDITESVYAKEALLAEKQRNEHILKGTNAGTWDLNLNSSELVINDKWAQLIGYRLDELSAIDRDLAFSFFHPEDVDYIESEMNKTINDRSYYYDVEFRMKHKDGHWIWVHSRGDVVEFDADNNPVRMAGTHLDISAERKDKMSLMESEKRFKTIFDKSKTVMLIVDPKTVEIVDANESAVKYYGYKKDELIGLCVDNINPLSLDDIKKEVKKAVSEHSNYFKFQHILKNGDIRNVDIYSSLIIVNDKKLLHSIIIDTTQVVEAEYQIQQVNKRFVALEKIIHYKANSINDLLDFTLDEILTFTQSEFGAVYHYNEDKKIFYLNNWSNLVNLSHTFEEDSEKIDCLSMAAQHKEPIIMNDFNLAYSFIHKNSFNKTGLKSMTIPIIAYGKVVALFWLGTRNGLYSKFHAEQLMLMLDTAWILVERQRLQDKMTI